MLAAKPRDIDCDCCDNDAEASAFERDVIRVHSDHGLDPAMAAVTMTLRKIMISLDAWCHAPT
jgi:hypothetical protein